MYTLYTWATPNGHKIAMALEELDCAYELRPVDIGAGDQFKPEFLRISPNNKIPALVHADSHGQAEPVALFESGAILQYLADTCGRLLPPQGPARYEALAWLYWQVGGLGPMAGQNHHFAHYAPERIPYAIERYVKETARLYGVLDRRLAGREFISGDFSVADIACYPWIAQYEQQQQSLADFPQVARWFVAMAARAAVQRAYARAEEVIGRRHAVFSEAERRVLFGRP